MKRVLLIIGLAICIITVTIGCQIAAVYLDVIELHDDLRDVAAQNGVNIGLNAPKTDDQVRKEVITTAAEHGLRLQPDQITLKKHSDDGNYRIWYEVRVDYTARINLFLYS